MRLTLIIIIVITSYLTACNNTSGHMTPKPKAPSTPHFVVALYDTGAHGKAGYRLDFIYRIIKDTVKFIYVDESTQKKKLSKDTTYYIMYPTSVLDSIGKKAQKKSGGDSLRNDWVQIDNRRILLDGGRIDSVISKYKQPK